MEDDDITMCGEGTGSINAKEKNGYVKEYIETEGLAMILSKEYGLILFHLDSVWIEGVKHDAGKTRTKLIPGTEIKFYDKTYQGAEYKELSEDQVSNLYHLLGIALNKFSSGYPSSCCCLDW